MPACLNDATLGGRFYYEWKGRIFFITGELLELDLDTRIVHVERMHTPDPTPDCHVETTFNAESFGRLMRLRMTLPDTQTRAAILATGKVWSWAEKRAMCAWRR